MRKRWIAACAAALLVLGAVGCGGSESGGTDTDSGKQSGDSAAKESGVTEYAVEQVLYEQEGVTITATGYQVDERGNHSIIFEVQNDTDSAIGMDCTGLSVNGLQLKERFNSLTSAEISNMMSVADSFAEASGEDIEEFIDDHYHIVAAGETREIEWEQYLDNAQKQCMQCMGEVQEIEISAGAIKLTDMEDMATLGAEEMPEGETVTIHTDAYEGEVKLPEIEGTEIYNQDGIRIVVMDMDYDADYGDLEIYVYAENNSDQEVGFLERDISVNDYVVDGMLTITGELESGTRAAGSVVIFDEVEIESLEDIESLEFTVDICAGELYETIGSAVYTYTP